MKERRVESYWVRNLLCGAVIGAGAILPGVSGSVLAVILGIYRPMMEMLTHPFQSLPKYWNWLLPLGIGGAAGFWIFAKGITLALSYSAAITTWLFVGLIVGTFPQLLREAGKEGHPPSAWLSFAVCGTVMFTALFYISRVASIHVEPNFWWWCFCGVLWGAGVVIPGMTTSSILMALDLYRPVMDGLSQMRLSILLGAVPGMLVTIAALAHVVSWLFRKHYAQAFYGILGIVTASTLVIIPVFYSGVGEVLLAVACGVGGFVLAYLLGKLDVPEK